MGLLADANAGPPQGQWSPKPPPGWEPGYTIGPKGGELCVNAEAPPDDWDDVLRELGLDTTIFAVADDTVEVRAWDMGIGGMQTTRLYYYRAKVMLRSQRTTSVDVDELCRRAQRLKPRKPRTTTDSNRALVVALADWQIGKGEGGGTEATVDRIHSCLDQALARARAEKPDQIVLAGLGDLAEGCNGWYPHQLYDIDLDEREQMRVASRLLLSAIDRFLGWPIVVSSCVSNHGEKRDDGKHRTSITDNRDLQLLDRVADVLAANPDRYHDVELVGPHPDDPTVTRFEVQGTRLATTHGHIGMTGRDATVAVDKWVTGQIKGQRPAADFEVLLTGHRHHFSSCEFGLRRTWFQAPAMDGGSAWFAAANGSQSHPGTLTLMMGDGCGLRGVSAPVIHEP